MWEADKQLESSVTKIWAVCKHSFQKRLARELLAVRREQPVDILLSVLDIDRSILPGRLNDSGRAERLTLISECCS